jgi:uncharacterized membrane protein (DUF2068 family)
MGRKAVTNRLLPASRVCRLVLVLTMALPRDASAHGEQLLVYPAATVVLLLVSGIALLGWRASRRLKASLVAILFGVHASLWFWPISVAELADAAGRMFVALIAIPLGVVVAVYVVVRRRAKRRNLDA